MALLFLKYYLTGIAFLFIFWCIGKLLLAPFSKKMSIGGYAGIFASLLLGITISVVLFSISFTQFKTVNLGFLLLFVFAFWTAWQNPAKEKITTRVLSLKKILVFILVFLCFYLWEALFLFKTGSFHFVLPHSDYIFSSNISETLLDGGYENFFMEGNFYNSSYHYMLPYHYFEIWLNSFIAFFSGGNNMISFMLCVFPIFFFLIWIGIVAIFEHFSSTIGTKEFFLAFLLLFAGGTIIYFQQTDFLLNLHTLAPVPLELATRKYVTFYVFILAAVLLFLKNQNTLAFISLIALPLVSITALPPLISGFLVFCFINIWLKITKWRFLFKIGAYLFLIVAFIAILYFYFNQSPFGLAFNDQKQGLFEKIQSVDYLKTAFNVVAGSGLYTLLLYLPMLGLAIFLLIKTDFRTAKSLHLIFLFFGCLIFSSLIVWAILWDMANAAGFYASSLNYLNILLILTFIYSCTSHPFINFKKLPIAFIGFLVMLSFRMFSTIYFNLNYKEEKEKQYSDAYINAVEKEIDQHKVNPYGAFMLNLNKYTTLYDKNTFFVRLGNFAKFSKNLKMATNINILQAPLSDDPVQRRQEEGLIRLSVFYQFVEEQKKRSVFRNNEQSQLDFINQHKINYLFLDKGVVLPELLQARIKKEVKDSRSGERFCIL